MESVSALEVILVKKLNFPVANMNKTNMEN